TWNCFGEELTRQLLSDFTEDDSIEAEFDTSNVKGLKEDQDQRNSRITSLVSSGIITVAQAQSDLGYTPDPDANYYLLPTNARPATSATAMARASQQIIDPSVQPSNTELGTGQGGKEFPPFYPKIIILRAESEPLQLRDGSKKKAYRWGEMI